MFDFIDKITELTEPSPTYHNPDKLRLKSQTRDCLLGCGKLVTDQVVQYKLTNGTTQNEKIFVGLCTTCQCYLKDNEFHALPKNKHIKCFSQIKDKYL